MGDVHAALMQKLLDVPGRERKAGAEHHHDADTLSRCLEAAEEAGAAHARKAIGSGSRRKPLFPGLDCGRSLGQLGASRKLGAVQLVEHAVVDEAGKNCPLIRR